MPLFSIKNVAIRGISACVPPKVEEVVSLPIYASREEAEKVIATTGVERKHVATDDITATDLGIKAAEVLLDKLGWERDSVDALCFATQTPDYPNHPDSFVVHEDLGLKEDCMCLDLFHGCPGWTMGMLTLSSLVSQGTVRRAILLAGDTGTRWINALDHESPPLFGDCVAATALETDPNAPAMHFDTGTRSQDGKSLIMSEGAFRHPYSLEDYAHHLDLLTGRAKPDQNTMDGMSVFSFGISVPPKSIKKLCAHVGVDVNDLDKVVIHQANAFIVKKIVKKLKIDPDKSPIGLRDYGNTDSASIPLAIVSECREEYAAKHLRTVGCAFGTGLSWASVYFETDHIVCPEVVIYDNRHD